MFDSVQLLAVGAVAVIDTALLAALGERRNRQHAPVPVLLMTAGAWLWHVGLFLELLAGNLSSAWAWPVHWLELALMAAGLVLMPGALLHGAWRLARTGYDVGRPPDRRYALAYLPMLLVLAVTARGTTVPAGDLTSMVHLLTPYGIGLTVANVGAAAVFHRVRRRLHLIGARPFFFWLAITLAAQSALVLVALLRTPLAWSGWQRPLALAAALSPVAPALLFAYFVLRYNFMRLALQRSLVYGAVLAGLVLAHQVIFQGATALLDERVRVAGGVVEVLIVAAIVLCYRPWRQRAAESLRYLVGSRIAEVRERARRLAVALSTRAGQPADELLAWFVAEAREVLDVAFVTGWLLDAEGRVLDRRGDPGRLNDRRAAALCHELRAVGVTLCTRGAAPTADVHACLVTAHASLAIAHVHGQVTGLLLVGCHSRNRELSDEEANVLALLVEQLAITLDHGLAQRDRALAERRALESEKLAVLGLLAGSIAHEVKNPLSAIKTIATVLAEDLGPDGPAAEDLRLIVGEVDRLAVTVAGLLDLARPGGTGSGGSVSQAVEGTLRLLRHLARQRGVALEARFDGELPLVRGGEHALREIFINLLANSLDAAGAGGTVTVDCRRDNGHVVAVVRDTGPGLSPDVRGRLFEPFASNKENGTGLGLYAVQRRVRELGGEVACHSSPGPGAAFIVKLPCAS
jgi:signal transduction histidine kinase